MIRHSKWFRIAAPDQPAADAARQALDARLDAVWHDLPLAAADGEKEIEHVHQLRVATRRAVAALKLFEDLLPRRRATRVRKKLKKIRKAAATARDLDVLAPRIKAIASPEAAEAKASLDRRIKALRHAAQGPLLALHRRLHESHFSRRMDKLMRRVAWREDTSEPTFQEVAQRLLHERVGEFFEAADIHDGDTAALHALRIRGKELRYAIEVLADAFEPVLKQELYPEIEELQEKLGEINDRATAGQQFAHWLGETQDEKEAAMLNELVAAEAALLRDLLVRFSEWWTPQRRDDLRARFRQL